MNFLCLSNDDSAKTSCREEFDTTLVPCGVMLSRSFESVRCGVFDSVDCVAGDEAYSVLILCGGGVGRAFGGSPADTSWLFDEVG